MKSWFFLAFAAQSSIALAGSSLDRAFTKAINNAQGRGVKVSYPVEKQDKAIVQQASATISQHYENTFSNLPPEATAAHAITKVVKAYEDIRVSTSKSGDREPVQLKTVLSYASVLSHFTITSSPNGASVSIDGQDCGSTTTAKWIGPGQHLVRVSLSGYRTDERMISIGKAANDSMNIELKP
jgi:PEGA domain-containing protein